MTEDCLQTEGQYSWGTTNMNFQLIKVSRVLSTRSIISCPLINLVKYMRKI